MGQKPPGYSPTSFDAPLPENTSSIQFMSVAVKRVVKMEKKAMQDAVFQSLNSTKLAFSAKLCRKFISRPKLFFISFRCSTHSTPLLLPYSFHQNILCMYSTVTPYHFFFPISSFKAYSHNPLLHTPEHLQPLYIQLPPFTQKYQRGNISDLVRSTYSTFKD